MTSKDSKGSLRRAAGVALAAVALVCVTVVLGLALGVQTRAQFEDIRKSWVNYSDGAERKGILLSEIRAHLGYGGIIHNFKNYVLRRDAVYLDRTRALMTAYHTVAAEFGALRLTSEEVAALETITGTIREYEGKLDLALEAASDSWTIPRTDALVRVDDEPAIAALGMLERQWAQEQAVSSARLLGAVGQGQTLIWIGFLSLLALVLAALIVGWLLYVLVRDLRGMVVELAEELALRRRLERSEGRLATAVEQSPATIMITDTDARIQYTNRKFTEVTGWRADEVQGQTPAFLQSGETSPQTYEKIRNGLMNGETWHGVFRNRKKDGSSYWAETTILPLVSPEGEIQNFIGVSEDVTETRQARDQVVRAQKLEAVGQLAGGVAHDFNNILTTIVGAAHLAGMDAPDGSDIAGEINQIDIAARRAQSLIRGLLTFARREPGAQVPVHMGEMIEEVIGLLRAAMPPMITITHTAADPPVFVLGDQTHLHQIVMNLCRNASEAMGGNAGEIVVTAAHCDPPEPRKVRPDGWVRLTVSDNGPGMSADTQAHLFEPFFTTKPMGKGSGLGLSVVYGLVDEMGGQITVESDLGVGSCFELILPGAAAATRARAQKPEVMPHGTERIMLIDDEAELVSTFRRLLLRLGYRVEAFTAPQVALERFLADPARFDLIISDMVMPDLSGDALGRKIREVRTDIPVIFWSAYKPGRVDLPGVAPLMLDKPVPPARLAQQIRALLYHNSQDG